MDKVLIVQTFTHQNQYCRRMHPKIAKSLTYKNSEILLIHEKDYPELTKKRTKEEIAAYGRQLGIEYARKGDYDWILFLDLDTEPDTDVIEKMLVCNAPLVGGLHAHCDTANKVTGYNYVNQKNLIRRYLTKGDLNGTPEVDGISGGLMLVCRGIFMRIDYAGYSGLTTIPGRYTPEDEYFQIKIYNSLKIRPVMCTTAKSWHYNEDGRAYKLWGEVKQWKTY